ncbi:MAG: ferredoxin-type protein NapG [Campylobacteraceae bacterium]|nr:ferredoxin-type protein NapG [Campylobacteraceae bacterium]
MKKLQSSERRQALLYGAKAISLAFMGSFVWGTFLSNQAKASLILRPPGAKSEEEFLKSCIRCGLCVEACPFNTLKLAKVGEKMVIGTPYFIPREIPCEMCVDIPCVPVCPTQALDPLLVSTLKDDRRVLDINMSKMGVAIVDQESCLAYLGLRREFCYRACPLIDKAINIEYKHNERTGKHATFLPIVHNDICTGCGKCEKVCPTEKATITILPRDVVLGLVGSNYIKGWEESDEKRVKNANLKEKQVSTDSRSTQNYLNNEEF